MKNEKHVALAQKISADFEKYICSKYGVAKVFLDEKEKIEALAISALQQVEAEALASKVVFPTDAAIETASMRDFGNKRKDNKEKYCTNNDFYMAVTSAFMRGAKWALSRLTLAPKEQVIRVPNTNSFLDECFNLVSDEYNLAVDIVTEHENAIKRLNPQARIEESNE